MAYCGVTARLGTWEALSASNKSERKPLIWQQARRGLHHHCCCCRHKHSTPRRRRGPLSTFRFHPNQFSEKLGNFIFLLNDTNFFTLFRFKIDIQNKQLFISLFVNLCGSVSKDFVYHASGHEFEFRLKWKFAGFPHHPHPWLLFSDFRVMAKWFGAHYNQEVRFSSAVTVTSLQRIIIIILSHFCHLLVHTNGEI